MNYYILINKYNDFLNALFYLYSDRNIVISEKLYTSKKLLINKLHNLQAKKEFNQLLKT